MDRIRSALGVNNEHTDEHISIRAELTDQQMRIRALDAYVDARTSRKDRRHVITPHVPDRRHG